MRKFLSFSFASLLVLAFCALSAVAQSTTDGAIGGTVKDPNGAVVPSANVTVRNEETNKESTTTTDDEGRFRVINLQPGNYTVTIGAANFAAFTQQMVVVEVGRVTSLDINLSLTGATGEVTITAEAPVINTDQQDFSSNINQTSINNLPINGSRWSNFAILTPGAVPDGTFGLISFRGISGLLNNSTVDGGDNNQAFFAEERGRTRISYSISQSAIREFQVNTSSYSAEYGRSAVAWSMPSPSREPTSSMATCSTTNAITNGAHAIRAALSRKILAACSRRLRSSPKMYAIDSVAPSAVLSRRTRLSFSSAMTSSAGISRASPHFSLWTF